MTSWDPPFPVELKRIRPKDEDYWDRWRAAPKAIVPLAEGQRIWGSRFGQVSSLRLSGARRSTRRTSIRWPRACRRAAFAMRRRPRPRAPPTSASTSCISVSSSWCRRCCWRICSSPSAWNSGPAKWDCWRRLDFRPPRSAQRSLREGFVLAGDRRDHRRRGRGRLRRADHVRPAHVVGRRGRHDRLELHVAPASLAAGVIGAFAAGLLALWLGVRAMSRRSARSLLNGDAETRQPRVPQRRRKLDRR